MCKLKIIFYISIPLFIIHSIEEYVTLYYMNITTLTITQQEFVSIEGTAILVFIFTGFLLAHRVLPAFTLIPFGFFYLYQSEHVYNTLRLMHYYPGLFTGVLLIILGIFFWREIICVLRRGKYE